MPTLYSIRMSMTLCKGCRKKESWPTLGRTDQRSQILRPTSGLNNNASILYSEYAWLELLSGDTKCLNIFHGFTHPVLTNTGDIILHHTTSFFHILFCPLFTTIHHSTISCLIYGERP